MAMENIEKEDLLQNLLDAGCDQTLTGQCLKCMDAASEYKMYTLLQEHRTKILEAIHENQDRLECLDYLLYCLRKDFHNGKEGK